MLKLEKLHKELCRELGIHPARIRYDDTIEYLGLYNSRNQLITINLKRIRKYHRSPEKTLAHETYHHYQQCRGWLSPKFWKGKRKSLIRYYFTWSQRPWERGAIRYARKQAKLRGWI